MTNNDAMNEMMRAAAAKVQALEEVLVMQDAYPYSGFDRVGVQELIEKYRALAEQVVDGEWHG